MEDKKEMEAEDENITHMKILNMCFSQKRHNYISVIQNYLHIFVPLLK